MCVQISIPNRRNELQRCEKKKEATRHDVHPRGEEMTAEFVVDLCQFLFGALRGIAEAEANGLGAMGKFARENCSSEGGGHSDQYEKYDSDLKRRSQPEHLPDVGDR